MKIGALISLTTVILVLLYGQSRILYTIDDDGLTPYLSQMMIGLIVAVTAALVPIDVLGEMVSVGTLFAFVLVRAP